MSAVSENNRRRYRAILIGRAARWILCCPPEWLAERIARRFMGLWLRFLFIGPDGEVHRAGQFLLSEIARLALLDSVKAFHPDAQVMAYREGKREVGRQILALLNLDESDVWKMMEVDDGLGE